MLSNLVFSTTYQCTARCRYCGAECSPEQTDQLSLDDMIEVVDHVYSYGKLELVVFTGGEPFLLGENLRKAVEYCAKKGLSTRIVTNGFWAKDLQTAKNVVKSYKEAGLTELNLSCDDYHQEFIPLERIKYANDACKEMGFPALIGHKVMKGCGLSLDALEKALGVELSLFDPQKKNPANNVVSTGYNVPVAENMHLIPDEEILYPPSDNQWKAPCSTILKRVIITPRKELSICCGMIPRKVREIVFGPLGEYSLEELIARAHSDLIVNWLALEGPYGIMKFIQKKMPHINFRKRYVNICHLCSEIFTREDCREVLAEYAHEKVSEIFLERCLYDFIRNSKEINDEIL